jgi:hypothetical protein
LLAAYTVNEFGNWIGDVALAVLVFDRTGSPLATALLFVALRFAPAVIGPLLTTRMEVIAPRQILPVLYLGEAVIFGLMAVLADRFSLPVILVLAALDGVLAVATRSLIRSVNAAVLGRVALLREGNALINVGVTLGGAIGPALAGVLVAAEGPGVALGLDAATFALVATIIATASGLRLDSDRTQNALGRLRSGLRLAQSNPTVRRLLLGMAGTLLFGAAVIPIEVVFAKRTLHAGDSGYGLLMASWGIGLVIGSGTFAVASRARLSVVIAAGAALIGAAFAGLAVSPDLLMACAFSVIGGAGNGLWQIALVTALQQATPTSAMAVVMSVFESINQVMPGIGFVLGGVVTALGSARVAYTVAAVGVLIVLLAQASRPVSGLSTNQAEM